MAPVRRLGALLTVALVATAVAGGFAGGSAPDAAAAPAPTPPYATSPIQLVSRTNLTVGGTSFRWSFFRNPAYRCQVSGHFTFGVLERSSDVGRARPLWTYLHGGGVGHFKPGGGYAGSTNQSTEESSLDLLSVLAGHTGTGSTLKDTTVTRRIQEGHRILVPSMCDHDLYGGLGNPNPHTTNPGDTVDGLLATAAAIDFTANGRPGLAGFPTGRVFVHGGSAGSAGAYHVAHNLWERGIVLNGIVLDSYLVTSRLEALLVAGVLPQSSISGFDQAIVQEKVGPYLSDPDLLLEHVAAGGWPVPFYAIVSTNDHHFGGTSPAIAEAVDDGFDSNPRWVAAVVQDALDAGDLHDRSVVHVVPNGGHVVTNSSASTAVHDGIDTWLATAILRNPQPPFGFADVGDAHPFLDDITWMAASGISTGYADGTYRPSLAVSRQAMSAFLHRLRGAPPVATPAQPSFSDVGPAHPFVAEVEWMSQQGIATGYEDGRFGPLAPVTRQAMSAFLHRTAGEPPIGALLDDPFLDVSTTHPFAPEISWMAATSISEGYDDGTYRPAVAVSRQAMSAFLHRLACTPEAWSGGEVAPGTVPC